MCVCVFVCDFNFSTFHSISLVCALGSDLTVYFSYCYKFYIMLTEMGCLVYNIWGATLSIENIAKSTSCTNQVVLCTGTVTVRFFIIKIKL